MSLMEKNRINLPITRTKEWLGLAKRNIENVVRKGVDKFGILGLLLLIMSISTGLRLLWSSHFPLGWWIVFGILILNEVLKDKLVWKRDVEVDKLKLQLEEANDKIKKLSQDENGNTGS